jgi:hypothetical protein
MQRRDVIFDFRFSIFYFHRKFGYAAGLLAVSIVSSQAITDTPYQAIVDRNVFALKPPPPPPTNNPDANKPPPPPITLTGITTILGSKRAFMSVNMPAKPPEPAKVQSYMLMEGQRDGDIEVLEIDEKAGMVKVNEFGSITNLTWEKNGLKMTGGQPAPAPNPAGGVPPPPHNPFNPAAGAAGFNKAIPSRTLRLPGTPTAQPGGASSANPATGTGGFAGAVPGGTVAPNASSTGLTTVGGDPIPPERSPEETALLYEANRIKNEQLSKQGVPLPPMPQHVLMGGLNDGGGQAPPPAQTPVQQRWNPFAPPGGAAPAPQ